MKRSGTQTAPASTPGRHLDRVGRRHVDDADAGFLQRLAEVELHDAGHEVMRRRADRQTDALAGEVLRLPDGRVRRHHHRVGDVAAHDAERRRRQVGGDAVDRR
jgi:hypothetical protein